MKYIQIIRANLKRSLMLLMALVFMGTHGTAIAQSFTDNDLNSITDGTPWYDPFGGCGQDENMVSGGDITNEEGNSNIETAYNFFTKRQTDENKNEPGYKPGLSTMQAAAIIGNLEQESGPGIRPEAVNSIGATGSAQWLHGRKTGLMNYAEKHNNGDWKDLSLQLNYLWWEVTEGPEKVYGAVAALKGATNLTDAVTQWEVKFERAAAWEANIPRRVKFAQAVIDRVKEGKLGNGVITSPAESGGTAGGGDATAATSTCQNGSTASNAAFIDGFTVYSQCDKAWGSNPYGTSGKTICTSGCGPTAMAMIITAFKKQQVTPDKTTAFANTKGMYVTNVGSSHAVAPVLAKQWGLESKKIKRSIAAVNDVLKNGGLVITSGRGDKPFTSKGHYIVIRGVTADGKWKVGDSAHSDTSAKEWDPNFIIGQANEGSMYGIFAGSASI